MLTRGTVCFRRMISMKNQCRNINELTWAAQYLLKKGEVLEPVTPENRPPMVEFSPELLLRPTPYVKNLADRTLELTQIEMNQLSERLRVRIGISDADFHGSPRGKRKKKASSDADTADANLAPAEPVKVKEFFDVKIGAVDPKSKIKIIKEVRTITNLGLKEAKELVEKAPVVVKTGLKKEEAEAMKKALEGSGAEVELL